MAVSFTDSIVDEYVWSLERPMYLRYSKDSDNSAVNVTIAITQGTYSKTLSLRYSGLIKEIEMNIVDLIKDYFQHFNYPDEINTLSHYLDTAIPYQHSKTQKITVTITDNDNSINTYQYFIRNGNNIFTTSTAFGGDNYSIKPEGLIVGTEYKVLNLYKYNATPYGAINYDMLNIPSLVNISTSIEILNIKIEKRKLDGTLLSTDNIDPTTIGDDKILAFPIGFNNGNPATHQDDGIIIDLEYESVVGGTVHEFYTTRFTIYYTEYCDISRKKTVYYEGRYGGIDMITFANNIESVSKKSNEFILQGGEKERLNTRHRRSGSYISEYANKVDNDKYASFFVSDKIQSYTGVDLISILLTSKSHKIKQVDNVEMKQYIFAYEEVERLKY